MEDLANHAVHDADGDLPVKNAREHDRILKEIETTDTAFVGASLRAIYEGSFHEPFMQKLNSRINQHDRDIERLCNFHYQGFIESITELIKVRGDAEVLKTQVIAVNTQQQESGLLLCRKSEDLLQCRSQQRNIASAIDELTICLPVLQTYGKMMDQLNAKRYYSALKTLEKLEHTYFPTVHKYRYCEIMMDNVSKIREQIRNVSISELKTFLEVVRVKSPAIGKLAMSQVNSEKRNVRCASVSVPPEMEQPKLSNTSKNQSRSNDAQSRKNPFDDEPEIDDNISDLSNERSHRKRDGTYLEADDKDLSMPELIDFSPVYKCLHIFGILKYHDQFEKYYRTQRKTQALITCQPPSNMRESIDSYMLYFHQIVGFFIIEDYVLHTASDLIDEAYISNLWNMALSEIISALRTDTDYCDNADTLMTIKSLIVLFADTLKAYGFSVDQLFEFLVEMREQYGEILLKKWAGILQKIFDEDNYTPMTITSESDAVKLLASFPFEGMNIAELKMDTIRYEFPKVLPFSLFVPCVLHEIKEFIRACIDYCEDLHLSSTEVDDMIRKSVNLLLTRTLSTELQKLIQKSNLGLTELVQISINISYLEKLCDYVEEYVCSVTGVHTTASHSAKLVGVSTFKDARSEAESRIYINVNSKIDEFFDLCDYDWEMTEPKGTASSYLLDLIAYLKHNFKVFTHLPEKVAQTACMSACKHIGSKLMGMLLDTDVKQITMAALQQYNLDVMQCEFFANSEPVPGFQDGVLQMSFLEIRQLLDLFLSWDWSAYLADYRSGNSKYLRVSPATALSLLERIKEDSKRWNILTSFNRQEREKRRLLETVLKQLRAIMQQD